MKRILVSTSSFGRHDPAPLELLASAGYKPVLNPYGRTLSADEVVELAAGSDGIVAGTEKLDRETLAKLPGLKVISRVGSGTDSVDLEAAKEMGIAVKNTPDGPAQAVAELAIGLALTLLRGIAAADAQVRQGVWRKEMGRLLGDKRVGIIGLGKIGKRVAGLYQAFGCQVSACDPWPDADWAAGRGVDILDLEPLLADCDIISIHAAAGGGCLIGAAELARMKAGAVVINTARGSLIDEAALIEALSSGRLGGAALDVFEREPYSGQLREMSNVVLTPHIGSYAIESRVQMEKEAVENLLAVLAAVGS